MQMTFTDDIYEDRHTIMGLFMDCAMFLTTKRRIALGLWSL